MSKEDNMAHKRHSLAQLLAATVLELYPNAKPTIGPAIDGGFYYDFDDLKISDADLPKIEERMREILKKWEMVKRVDADADEAKKIYAGNPYKLELIGELLKTNEKITLYYSGSQSDFPSAPSPLFIIHNSSFVDLCKGGHIEKPNRDIKSGSWKLDKTAGAYWRGDEKNKMLTRIYGLAFESEKQLKEYETKMEESKKRDHKKLGVELDLFTFSPLVGAGLPLWTPKGTLLRDLLDSFVWELRQKAGYEKVDIPHITKKDLYEKSGHWSKFGDELFRIKTREEHEFVIKPMNCPHHTQIYARRGWSYRDMPQRYASTTKVYRDEQTGELTGLARVRSITQDDAHVFCRQNQIKEETKKIWDIVLAFYQSFDFKLKPRLSLHDPKNISAYLGTEEIWRKAEEELRAIVKEKGMEADEAVGEAAFYGPKVDFMAEDSLGREWQVATFQLDMNMPERFDLTFINESGEKERAVMIHTAIMGSIERFLAILIEHFAGAFPTWLSPVQVKILPIADKQKKTAEKIAEALKEAGIRAELDDSKETLGKKVRAAKLEKVPYFVVIGEKEEASGTITVEGRKGKIGEMNPEEFFKKIKEEVATKKSA